VVTLTEFPSLLKVCKAMDLLRNLTSFIYDHTAIGLIIQQRTLSVSDGSIYTVRSTQGDTFTPILYDQNLCEDLFSGSYLQNQKDAN
jgi:hypothetical protein